MKLQTKLLTMFSLLFTVGFVFLLFFTSSAIAHNNRRMVDAFSSQSFEFKAQEVGEWLGQRVTELRVITCSRVLQDDRIEPAIPYIARLNENVGVQYGNEWGTFAIGYLDGIGWVSEDLYIDVSEREYFHEAMKGEQEYVLSEPVTSRTDAADISLICYPLHDREGKIYGFLNAAISLQKLEEIVAELEFYDGKSWIMDSRGNIYTRAGADLEVADELVPELAQLSESGRGSLHSRGSEMVFYTSIPYTQDWFLCTAVHTSLLMRDTMQMVVTLTMVFLAVMVILFFASFLMARSITRPVKALECAMQAVEDGNWEVDLEAKGKDEIAHLSRVFDKMVKRIHALVLKTAENEREKRAAELRVLQAQINPHFLYNTLDTLLYKAYETGDDDMITMIESLSAFFRISLSRGKELIPLEKELEHVSSYLKIQKIRFQDVLNYEIRAEAADSFTVLKLILQPLAENAIQHGIKPKLEAGRLLIHVWQEEGYLLMEVCDDGVGMNHEKLDALRRELRSGVPTESYGLINVSNRIRLLYGDAAEVLVDSEEGKGTTVRIRLPGTIRRDMVRG